MLMNLVFFILASATMPTSPFLAAEAEDRAEALVQEGNIHYLNGDFEKALDYYNRAVLADPNSQNAASNYALTLSRIGRSDKAGWYIFEYIREHPTAAWAWNIRAIITEETGQYNKCLDYVMQALRYDPNLSAARYNRACYLARLNRRPEALRALAYALAAEPGLSSLAYYDDDLESLNQLPQFWTLLHDYLNP